MTQQLSVDLGSAVPVYEQLRSQFAALIATGELVAGDRLPTVRALASDLGIAVNTVGRAYSELEAGGCVTSDRRRGTVVAGPTTAPPPRVLAEADRLARTAFETGTAPDTVLAVLRAALLREAGG